MIKENVNLRPSSSPPTSSTAPSATKDRVIRVFISSTFRDMQYERDILIKKIFPQLRKLCEECVHLDRG